MENKGVEKKRELLYQLNTKVSIQNSVETKFSFITHKLRQKSLSLNLHYFTYFTIIKCTVPCATLTFKNICPHLQSTTEKGRKDL